MKFLNHNQVKGQALLPLLIIVLIVLSLGTAVIELAISNTIIGLSFQGGLISYYTTEAALENGLLRILRNPSYAGESLQINGASCTIGVSGVSPKIISVSCNTGQQVRKMQAEASFADGKMTVANVKEIE